MKKIKADKFLSMIRSNPSVFENWETPLEITTFVSCRNSPITHLSKHLIFSGRDSDGDVANFSECLKLKIATGTFHRFVYFSNSGIQKIENLTITQTDADNHAASFTGCKSLQIATGTYPGYVTFANTGIITTNELHILSPSNSKNYVSFIHCPNLKTLENWDISKQIRIEPEKLAAEKERRAIQKFHEENQIETLPFL
jgi:hypothetical protein